MDNLVTVFWDDILQSETKVVKSHLEIYLATIIAKNESVESYIGKDYTFQFIDNPGSIIDNSISVETTIIFVLAELKQDKDTRTSFRGLHLVKLLRKNRIKLPIVLFSFLNEEKDLDFCDKDDFIDPKYMQFFVRLPGLILTRDAVMQNPLRWLRDDELDELLNNQYDKKKKASLLLDKLKEGLEQIPDADKHKAMEMIKNTFQSIVMWAPEKASHAIYKIVLPNKLKRLRTQSQRIDLLEEYRHRLLEGIATDHDGLVR